MTPKKKKSLFVSSLFIQELKRAKKEVECALAEMKHGSLAGFFLFSNGILF